jgi:peroxiredoxin
MITDNRRSCFTASFKTFGVKKGLFFLAVIIIYQTVFAQQDTTPLFRRFPSVPPISLLKTDSALITKDKLKKNRPVIIMYFSPDCHHCQRQVEEMIARMDDLKKIQIILATYQPMEDLLAFQNRYKLYQYPNISAGRDTKYFIQPFYKIKSLPYQALYDKKGNLVTVFEGNVSVDKLLEAFE